MMNKDNQIQGLDSYLREKFELGKGINYLPNDEWIKIFSYLTFQRLWKDGKAGKEWEGIFTEIDWEGTEKGDKEGFLKTKHDFVISLKEPIYDYPFNKELLLKIINLKALTVGNPDLGEQIRINHIEPIKYLCNLKELCICNNTVTSLKPIWGHPNLKRVWIENTLIPLEERRLFKEEHPDCELAEQGYN